MYVVCASPFLLLYLALSVDFLLEKRRKRLLKLVANKTCCTNCNSVLGESAIKRATENHNNEIKTLRQRAEENNQILRVKPQQIFAICTYCKTEYYFDSKNREFINQGEIIKA